MQLKEGDTAPDFELDDTNGRKVKLSSLKGKTTLLYFYPKDDTPGCTTEACSFRDDIAQFKKKQAVVLGISRDDEDSHQKFTKKFDLNFPLLSDHDSQVSKLYGAYGPKVMYGKAAMGITRMTFVIDQNLRIKKIFPKVNPEGHSKEILALL